MYFAGGVIQLGDKVIHFVVRVTNVVLALIHLDEEGRHFVDQGIHLVAEMKYFVCQVIILVDVEKRFA